MSLTKTLLPLLLLLCLCTEAHPQINGQSEAQLANTKSAAVAAHGAATTVDPAMAKVGLWILGGVSALTLIAAGSIGFAAVWKETEQTQKVVSDAIRGGVVMRMGTIFGIVTAACILALCGALTEGVIAFLSGIAGYVLGGIQRGSNNDE